MTPNVSQYINKTVLVSIPTRFLDGKSRPLKLIGVDVPGLWLLASRADIKLSQPMPSPNTKMSANPQPRRRLMAPQLNASLNRPVLVAIPALFADTEVRRCRLVGVEPSGLWLVAVELANAIQPRAERAGAETEAPPAIFVPFAQIAAVVPVAAAPVDAAIGLKPAAAAESTRPTGSTPPLAATAPPKPSNTKTSKPPQ